MAARARGELKHQRVRRFTFTCQELIYWIVMSFGRDTPRISNTWEDSSTGHGTAHGLFGHEHHELPALVAYGLLGHEHREPQL